MKPVVSLLALAACTPGTIVTVQPNAIPKTAFAGEWFWRRTVEAAPYGTTATFVGASDTTERLVWAVEEDLLVGRRSLPHVDGLPVDDGPPLLVFPITDQFDIRRGYDRATGEESNVVEENRERPWYDREFVRVDFSSDLSGNGFTMAGLEVEVAGWITGDDRAADAPQFDDSDGDGAVDSLLVTQHALVAPDDEELEGYGTVPTCLFYGQAEYECEPSELSIVHSFVRVDERAPYEGQAVDDRDFQTFGYFTSDRLAWDDAYGLLEPNRTRWANRHRLWDRSFATDADGQVLCHPRGDDEAVAPCTSFSAADDPKPVRLRYADRVPEPIVYHAGPGFPADLAPIMEQVAAEWNEPLVDTVNGLRYWECIDEGGKKAECEAAADPDLQLFVWCPHNPSLPGDPALCSTDHTGPQGRPDGVGDPVRIGDLRYHLAVVVPEPNLASPYGYGPSAADPVGTRLPLADGTYLPLGAGEILSGTAFLYEPVLNRVSTQVADLVALLNGEISPDDFAAGEDVRAWVEAVKRGDTASFVGAGEGRWTEARVAERLAKMDSGFQPLLSPWVRGVSRPTHPTQVGPWLHAMEDALGRSGALGAGAVEVRANWDRMTASDWDALAWSPDALAVAGFDPSRTDPASLGDRSPFDAVAPARAERREQGRILAGTHAVDLDEGAFTDSTLLGLARHYARLGWDRERIVQDVREQSFREVMLHEVGHTLGLRHNFSGSLDAFNFRPEYWALRQDGDMGPRHVDPETDAEVDGRIREFQYSTVMDYPGARNVGWAGLGHWDHAAIKFGYGRLVEVMPRLPDEPVIENLDNDEALGWLSYFSTSNVLPGLLVSFGSGDMVQLHYTDYPAIAGDLEARVDVPMGRLASTMDDTDSFAGALVVEDEAPGVPRGAPVVPYRFCSDELAVGINCARFDEGADPYEQITFLTERYWNDYVLTNFARERYGFGDTDAYVSRVYDRTFDPIRTWQVYFTLFHGILDADHDPAVQEFLVADRGWGGWTAGTDHLMRFLTQVITRPEPGPHAAIVRPDGTRVLAPSYGAADVELPVVQGAYYESEWNHESGYHWFETQARIGTYHDRMLALQTLTDATSFEFMGYDTAIDPKEYALGFQDLYGDHVRRVVAELLADDVDRFAPALRDDGRLLYPDPLDPEAAWPPRNAELVQPATYWLVRYDAMLFGLSLLDRGYDHAFQDRSRIYVEGTPQHATAPPGQEVIRFDDPHGGGIFDAWSFPLLDAEGEKVLDARGVPIELGAGARMVRHAQALSARCANQDAGGLPFLAEEDADAACAELERYTSDLDLLVQLYADAVEGEL
jgi:hypothetical protein